MPRAKKPALVKVQTNTGMTLPAAPPGLPYGERQTIESSVAAAPPSSGAGGAPPASAPAPDTSQMLGAVQQYQAPQGDLMAPSARPGEPVTAGLPSGPGAGPDALGLGGPMPDPVLAQLQALYRIVPNDDLAALIAARGR